MKQFASILALLLCASASVAQPSFAKGLQFMTGLGNYEARRIIRTPDKNYLVVGYAQHGTANSVDRNGLVFKMNNAGTVIWAYTYGGAQFDELYDVVQIDKNYYCVGYTNSWTNTTFSTPNVLGDAWVMKLDLNGGLVWAKHMGTYTTGTNATTGNEQAFRVVTAGTGGIVVLVRTNSGATTDQGTVLTAIDALGNTLWAYQYQLATNPAIANELTFGLWKDKFDSYIAGGWLDDFSTKKGGWLLKVNSKGNAVYSRYNKFASTNLFQSQYMGFYSPKTGLVYTTDYYTDNTTPSVREMQVMVNRADNGQVPVFGTGTQPFRMHYGAAGSASNKHRGYLFSAGDGYSNMIHAGYFIDVPTTGTLMRATLVSHDINNLGANWRKEGGAVFDVTGGWAVNKIFDMIPCDGNDQDMLAVGTIHKNNEKEILIERIPAFNTASACDITVAMGDAGLSPSGEAITLSSPVNLNGAGCSPCWGGAPLITNTTRNDITTSAQLTNYCQGAKPGHGAPENDELNFIQVEECATDACLSNLKFEFTLPVAELFFEITDLTGDFLYHRTFGETDALSAGLNFQALHFKPGEYKWEINAAYPDKEGVEIKFGRFIIE